MIDRENLLRCKLALYRELLNVKDPSELTLNEAEIGYLLVLDADVQAHIQKGIDRDKDKN
jgi:hypothetical protein